MFMALLSSVNLLRVSLYRLKGFLEHTFISISGVFTSELLTSRLQSKYVKR